jgi:hypothetical protein
MSACVPKRDGPRARKRPAAVGTGGQAHFETTGDKAEFKLPTHPLQLRAVALDRRADAMVAAGLHRVGEHLAFAAAALRQQVST